MIIKHDYIQDWWTYIQNNANTTYSFLNTGTTAQNNNPSMAINLNILCGKVDKSNLGVK